MLLCLISVLYTSFSLFTCISSVGTSLCLSLSSVLLIGYPWHHDDTLALTMTRSRLIELSTPCQTTSPRTTSTSLTVAARTPSS
eukprot:1333068-Rhodomonas_salina.1